MTVQTPASSVQAQPPATPAADDDPLSPEKQVEFYAATVNAWYATTLEHDKSLFVLAGGGIGIMISLLTTVGFDAYWVLLLFLVAILSFLNCLAYLLRIFEGNRHYLEALVTGGPERANTNLKRWDAIAKTSFLFGVIFSAAVAVAVSALKISNQPTDCKQVASETATPAAGGSPPHGVQGMSLPGAHTNAPASPAASAASAPAATASPPAKAASTPAAAAAKAATTGSKH